MFLSTIFLTDIQRGKWAVLCWITECIHHYGHLRQTTNLS